MIVQSGCIRVRISFHSSFPQTDGLKRGVLQVVIGSVLVLVSDVEECCFVKMISHQLQADVDGPVIARTGSTLPGYLPGWQRW